VRLQWKEEREAAPEGRAILAAIAARAAVGAAVWLGLDSSDLEGRR
jgi:hypothetical protein